MQLGLNPDKQLNPLQFGFDKEPIFALCLKHKVCCVTFRSRRTNATHLHHTDAIGRGFDRTTYDDSNHRKMQLIAELHQEAHTIGQSAFEKKYGVFGILYNTNEKDPMEE